jgi:hypothetical protein
MLGEESVWYGYMRRAERAERPPEPMPIERPPPEPEPRPREVSLYEVEWRGIPVRVTEAVLVAAEPTPAPPQPPRPSPRQDAETKALKLLREWLSPEQLAQFDRELAFEVTGYQTNRRYRIQHGQCQNVYEFDADGKLGRGLCFVPDGCLATGDVMLAQKIALETEDELAAIGEALVFWRPPGQVIRETRRRMVEFFATDFGHPVA